METAVIRSLAQFIKVCLLTTYYKSQNKHSLPSAAHTSILKTGARSPMSIDLLTYVQFMPDLVWSLKLSLEFFFYHCNDSVLSIYASCKKAQEKEKINKPVITLVTP